MPPSAPLTVGTTPVLIASAYTPLVVVANTGGNPVRVVTRAGDPDHGRVIAAGTSVELEPGGRTTTLSLVADAASTAEVTRFTVRNLRASASAHYGVPVELLSGTSKAAIAASAA